MPVRVEGLKELRLGVREIDRGMLKEIQAVTRSAAQVVAAEASRLAPRKTGRLAGSIKGTTSGPKGIVRSRLVYAPVLEYGGTIAPRGTEIRIKRHEFVHRALRDKTDQIERELLAGYDQVVRRAGWR